MLLVATLVIRIVVRIALISVIVECVPVRMVVWIVLIRIIVQLVLCVGTRRNAVPFAHTIDLLSLIAKIAKRIKKTPAYRRCTSIKVQKIHHVRVHRDKKYRKIP